MIKSLSIKNFLGFRELEAEKLTPVNIIIGPNDSGKAGLLKMLCNASDSEISMSRYEPVVYQAFGEKSSCC